MSHQQRQGKKRKQCSEDLSLFQSFSAAAAAVSQLYAAASAQTKAAEAAGARRALERVAQFIVKEYGNAPAVPTAVLMEVLRHELQASQGSTAAVQLPFPAALMPGCDSSDAPSDDEHLMGGEPSPGFRRTPSGHTISPPKGPRGQPPSMFQQAQQAQQAQMQAAAAQATAQQQLHYHMLQAQAQQQQAQQQQLPAQQQQQPGFGFGQPPFQ